MGLMSFEGGGTFKELIERLRDNGTYCITWHVLNSHDYGVPQSRQRVYVIGIRAEIAWDTPVFDGDKLDGSLSVVLDTPEIDDDCDRFPPSTQATARANIASELVRLRTGGVDPATPDRIMDVDCSVKRAHRSTLHSPCLTFSRKHRSNDAADSKTSKPC